MNPAPLAAFLGLLPRHAIGLGFCLVVLVAAVAALLLRNRRASGGARRPAKPRPAGAPGMVEIYVGNLSYDMNDAQLNAEFSKYGIVESARIITHPSGKSKGYGFVHMPHRAEAEIACKALNGADVMGRKLRVNEARGASK